jgi:Fibronectin type III domain
MPGLGIDSFLLLTPFLVFAIIVLLGFVGCDLVFGLQHVPDPVQNLQAVAGNSQVTLTWDSLSGATDYHVVRSPGGGTTTDIDTMSASTTFVDTGLTNGTTYTYYVYAITSDGNSGNSASVSATPDAAISFAQMQASSQGTNPPIAVTLNNTTQGNLLIAAVSYGGPAAASVSVADNLGNNFTLAGNGPWFRQSRIFYLPNIPGGNVTITATGAGGATGPCSMCVSEYNGADLTSAAIYSFSTKASPGAGTAGVEPIQGVAVSLAQSGDVTYVVIFATQPTALAAGAGFVARPSPTTSLLVEDSTNSATAADTVATLNSTGGSFVPWVALAVGIKA